MRLAVTVSGTPATGNVVGAGQPLGQHVMLLRGYGIKDEVPQGRADLADKGNGDEGLIRTLPISMSRATARTRRLFQRWRNGLHHRWLQPAGTAGLYDLDLQCGRRLPSGIGGADQLPTQWQTFSDHGLFDTTTAQQRATNPGLHLRATAGQRYDRDRALARRVSGDGVRGRSRRSTHSP